MGSGAAIAFERPKSFELDLEHEVAPLIDKAEQSALLWRRLQTHIVTIEHGTVYTYPLKGRPAQVLAAARAVQMLLAVTPDTDDS